MYESLVVLGKRCTEIISHAQSLLVAVYSPATGKASCLLLTIADDIRQLLHCSETRQKCQYTDVQDFNAHTSHTSKTKVTQNIFKKNN